MKRKNTNRDNQQSKRKSCISKSPADEAANNTAGEASSAPTAHAQSLHRKPPIAAVGASAGGLEALKAFFSHVPPDCGIGFVVVTHVSPNRESMLPELLSRVTDMKVFEAEDDMPIAPNTVVVAKDSLLTISEGRISSLKNEGEPEKSYHPIDYFFHALASDQRDYAIGVVLSGSGNDGALGLKAIKAAGGMAMVQTPATAGSTGMPISAEETGLADYVLPPDQLPEALHAYCNQSYLQKPPGAEQVRLPDAAIEQILLHLRKHSGHDFTQYKMNTISRRIERRMNIYSIEEPQLYLKFLQKHPEEIGALLQELLISVTRFFRDPDTFVRLGQLISDLLHTRNPKQKLRVWIPGCATGEEAYSIAILFNEQMRKLNRTNEFCIFATDLD